MAKIEVTVKADAGELGIHPKFGKLVLGTKLTIEEEDFAAGLFDRPHPAFLSPLEKKDQERAAEEKRPVGHQLPPEESTASTASTASTKKAKEVTSA